MVAERKTLSDLPPNEYYNRIVADITSGEAQHNPSSNSFTSGDSKRKVPSRKNTDTYQSKVRENLSSRIQKLKQEERPLFDQESLEYFERNPHALDKIYHNYVNKRATGRNGLERIEVPTFSNFKEKEQSFNEKMYSQGFNKSFESNRSLKRERSTNKKSQGLSVRFSLDAQRKNSARVSKIKNSSSGGPKRRSQSEPKKKLAFSQVKNKKQKAQAHRVSTSPTKSLSSVSRASKDLDNSISSYLGYRGTLTPSNVVEKMINKSFDGASVHTLSTHISIDKIDKSHSSIMSRDSSHSKKHGEGFVAK